MITQQVSFSPENYSAAEWPKQSRERDNSLFRGRAPLRCVNVMVDAALLDDDPSWTLTPERLLAGMLAHPHVKFFRYADGGPPATWPRAELPHFGIDYADGWVEVSPNDGNSVARYDIKYSTGGAVGQTAIVGNALDFVRRDVASVAYRELGHDTAYQKRYCDALAAQAAGAMHMDLYITERAYLREAGAQYSRRTVCCTVKDAIQVLSLYLRSQGEFELIRSSDGTGSFSLNEGLFFWVGARKLLPEAWRWFSACVHHASAVGDEMLTYLGGSAVNRVQRALRARDDVLRALYLPQNNDTAEDALSALDVVWLNLMGAVDVTARVAHLALGLPNSSRSAGWQRDNWLHRIASVASALAAVVTRPSEHAHTLTVLGKLRNSVHGEALHALGLGIGNARTGTLIGIPRDDGPELLASVDALGGRTTWGIRELIPGQYHVEPAVLLDQLFPRILSLLNAVMHATPVEQFQHAQLKPEDSAPPSEEMSPFAERNRLSIRWQLGF